MKISQMRQFVMSNVFLWIRMSNAEYDANHNAGLILGLRPVNERRRYFVTTSLIGWVQA